MTTWIDVCAVDDLVPNAGICALVDKQQIAIFSMPKIDGLFAIDNFDPFSGANVLSRGMVGDLGGEPMLASPMYKQHFSLKTGQCFEDEAVKVAVYAVQVCEGKVQIGL
ncbi:MAG: nitrite reductase small subunit NirD [Methylomonas sp.]